MMIKRIYRIFFLIGLMIFLYTGGNPVFAQGGPKGGKFQIQIEEEIEQGVEASDEDEQENIVVSGEDEKLIRTFKDDTSFISPTGEGAVKWLEDRQIINKDGKTTAKQIEKNGEILAAYGLYNNSFLFVNLIKSDKFGLYRLEYQRTDLPAENYSDSSIANSNASIDNLNISTGSRVTPKYTLMFNTRYQGATVGLQENPSYTELTRRWGFLSFENQIKPDNNQVINADISADYLDAGYTGVSGSDSNITYVNAVGDLQWIFLFDNKMSMEIKSHYDFLYLDDLAGSENHASTVKALGYFHWPIIKTFTGPSKGTRWQMNFNIGAGAYYREGIEAAPVGEAYLENRLGIWYSRISSQRQMKYPDLRNPLYFSYYTLYEYIDTPEEYWDFFWENSFTISKGHIAKLRGGYRNYDNFFNPVLTSDEFYSFSLNSYEEVYARAGWEFGFLRNFVIEASIDINYGLTEANMRPLYEFLLSAGYDSERFDAMITFKGVGSRTLGVETIGDYYLLNASIKFWINPSFSLIARGENLLNREYVEYFPYKTSGIKIFLGCYIKI